MRQALFVLQGIGAKVSTVAATNKLAVVVVISPRHTFWNQESCFIASQRGRILLPIIKSG